MPSPQIKKHVLAFKSVASLYETYSYQIYWIRLADVGFGNVFSCTFLVLNTFEQQLVQFKFKYFKDLWFLINDDDANLI